MEKGTEAAVDFADALLMEIGEVHRIGEIRWQLFKAEQHIGAAIRKAQVGKDTEVNAMLRAALKGIHALVEDARQAEDFSTEADAMYGDED